MTTEEAQRVDQPAGPDGEAGARRARVLDGTATAAALKAELTVRVARLRELGATPGLGTILVGDDPASHRYVAGKHRDCAEVGITSIREELPADATQTQVEDVVDRLNADPACTGYIVQLPLPAGLDAQAVLERIDPLKDADGLHPLNLGRLVLAPWAELSTPLPCTPQGILALLRAHGVPLAGAHVAVVGRGITVGRPIGLLLSRKLVDATVTLCDVGAPKLAEVTRSADVIVAATGFPGLIRPGMVKPGAAVLDVGITRVTDPHTGRSRLVGDVDPGVAEVAGWLSPNPGGVGPMTRAMLLANVVEAAERAAGLR